MDEYVLIGDEIPDGCTIFELRLADHLPDVDPESFGLNHSVPHIIPLRYFATSGDALFKTIQLKEDLEKCITQASNIGNQQYLNALKDCLIQSKILIKRLKRARGNHHFLETEWKLGSLIVAAKDPRAPKSKCDHDIP